MADTRSCRNNSSPDASLSTLPYKQLQQIAMSLRLPANLKQCQLITIIEAHYSHDSGLIERVLRTTREMRNRGRALRLRSSSSPPEESLTISHSDPSPALSQQQLTPPGPSSSPEDLTCASTKKESENQDSAANTTALVVEKSLNSGALAIAEPQEQIGHFQAEELTQFQDGLHHQNSPINPLNDSMEGSPSCASDSVTNSVSSDIDALVDAHEHCMSDMHGKESVDFAELKPVPPTELIDLSAPLIEASLDFTRHGLGNDHSHDVLLYPPQTLAQALMPYSEMEAEDIITSDSLVSLTLADSTGQTSPGSLKRSNVDDVPNLSKSRKTSQSDSIQASVSLVATMISSQPSSYMISKEVPVSPHPKSQEMISVPVSNESISITDSFVCTTSSSQEPLHSSTDTLLVSSTSFREDRAKGDTSLSTPYLSSGPASPSLCCTETVTCSSLNGDVLKSTMYSLSAPPSLLSNPKVTVTKESVAVSTLYMPSSSAFSSLSYNHKGSLTSSSELVVTESFTSLPSNSVSSSLLTNKKVNQSCNRNTKKCQVQPSSISIVKQSLLRQDTTESSFASATAASSHSVLSTSSIQPKFCTPGTNGQITKRAFKNATIKCVKKAASAPATRKQNAATKKSARTSKLLQDLCYLYPERVQTKPKSKTITLSQPATSDSVEVRNSINISANNARQKPSSIETHFSQFNIPALSSKSARVPEQYHILFNNNNENPVDLPKKNQYSQVFPNLNQNSAALGTSNFRVANNAARTNAALNSAEGNLNTSFSPQILPPFNRLYKELSDVQKPTAAPRIAEIASLSVSQKPLNVNTSGLVDQFLSLPSSPSVPPASFAHLPASTYGSQLFAKECGLPTPMPEPQTDFMPSQYLSSACIGQNPPSDVPWLEQSSRSNNFEASGRRMGGTGGHFHPEYQTMVPTNPFVSSHLLAPVPDHYGEMISVGSIAGRQTVHNMQGYSGVACKKPRPSLKAPAPLKAKDLLREQRLSACLPPKLEFLLNHKIDTQTVAFPVVAKHVPTFRMGRMDYVFVTSGVVPLTTCVDSCGAPISSPTIKPTSNTNQATEFPRVPQPIMPHATNPYAMDFQLNGPARIQSPYVGLNGSSQPIIQANACQGFPNANWSQSTQQLAPPRMPMHQPLMPNNHHLAAKSSLLSAPNNAFYGQTQICKPSPSLAFHDQQMNNVGCQSSGLIQQQAQQPLFQPEIEPYPCQPYVQNLDKVLPMQESQNMQFVQEQAPQLMATQDQFLNQCHGQVPGQIQQDLPDFRGRNDQLSLSMIYSYLASTEHQLNVGYKDNQQGGVESASYQDNQAQAARPLYALSNGVPHQNQAIWGSAGATHVAAVQPSLPGNADAARARSNYVAKATPRRQQTPENTTVTREVAHASVAAVRKSVCRERQKCMNSEKGCSQTFPLSQLPVHEANCEYKMLTCPKEGCDWNGRVRKIATHIREAHRAHINTGSDSKHILDLRNLKLLQDVCFLQEVSRKLFSICVTCRGNVLFISIQYIASGRSERPTVACGSIEVLGKDGQPRSWRGKLPPYQQTVDVLRRTGSCLEVSPETLGAFADSSITLHVSIRAYSGNTNVSLVPFGQGL